MTESRSTRKRAAKDCRELLRAGRWFRALPADLQDKLLVPATLRTFNADERIFSRGDAPSGLFAVIDGGVRVSSTTEEGRVALLTVVEPPAWFGEIAVFDGLERTHDATAEGETTVLQIPQSALDALLAAEPRYWRDLALLVTHKLRLTFLVLEEAAVLPIAVRLARRLLIMSEGYGEWHDRKSRAVTVKQEQLAAMLAISRQTANQALRRLEAGGVVKLSYGAIEILDHEALRRAAK